MFKHLKNKSFAAMFIAWALISIIAGIYTPAVKATTYFQDGFESGDYGAWTTHSGTVDISTTYVYTGTYAANVTSTGTYPNYVHYVSESAAYTSLWFCARYYIDTLSLQDGYRLKIMQITSNGPKGVQLWVERNGASYYWRVLFIDAMDSGLIATCAPAAGNWYGLELSWNHTGGSTYVQFYVNATSSTDIAYSGDYSDGYSSSTSACQVGSIDYSGAGSITVKSWFDDCSIGDGYLGCPAVGAPTPDTDPPAFLDGNPYLETNTMDWNSSIANETCSVSVNATDNVGLSGFLLSYTTDQWQMTWTNTTWQAASGTNTKITAQFVVPFPTAANWTIHANFYANDTTNNWGVSLYTWPATTLVISYVINATSVTQGFVPFVDGIGNSNKAGTRRVSHSSNGFWCSFYYYLNRIYGTTSADGLTWVPQGTINSGASGDLITNDDESAWSVYVWGTHIYCMYANGTYDAFSNNTYAFFRVGTISDAGTITWSSGANLIIAWASIITPQWPNTFDPNTIYGYYSFSFAPSLDGTRLWMGFRVTGGFTSDYSRIFIGWCNVAGSTTPVTCISTSSSSYYDTEQFSLITDPSFNTGFLIMWRSHDYGYVYYARWNGAAFQNVKYPAQNNWICPLISTTDWSTDYVPYLDRAYCTSYNAGTYYFADDPSTSGEFVSGGPTVAYPQVNIGHTDDGVRIVCASASNVLYIYTKEGLTPSGWTEGASWSSITTVGKAVKGFTSLSCTTYANSTEDIAFLWGNLTSSYNILFAPFVPVPSEGADLPLALEVITSPEIYSEFTLDGTLHITPQYFDAGNVTNLQDITLEALEVPYKSCKWIYAGWLINGSILSTDNPITINVTAFTLMTIVYTAYDPLFPEDYTTLNVDGNVSATSDLDHSYYWNPHSMYVAGNGSLVVGNMSSWSFDTSDGYVRLILDSNSTNAGHIAAGTWYSTWNTTSLFGVQARQPLASMTYILSFDINIVNVTYDPTSWLRIAIAVAWCDPSNTTGWLVKYVERDLYDNSIALNHTTGNAGEHDGNIIFSQGDVIEYQYASLPMNTWKHFDWNISQYIDAGWGDIAADGRLESAYCVIEVENITHSEVLLNNMWLRAENSTTSTQFNSWDSRVTRVQATNATARWVTVKMNGTDGYAVYADILSTATSVDPLAISNNGMASQWVAQFNGTSSLTLSDDSSFKMSGTDSLKMVGYRGSITDECFANYTWAGPAAWQDWTNYDFLIFFMYFNESLTYYHQFRIYDNNTNSIWWSIRDYTNNITSSGWSMITLPVRCPSGGLASAFNYANVTQFNLWPDRTDEDSVETYGKYFTIWMDNMYLEKGTNVYLTFNAPLSDDTNITIYCKKEITGWDGQYLAFINADGTVNGTNFQLLRPFWIKNWAPINVYSTGAYSVPVGYSEYGKVYSGNTASVLYGESSSSILVNGTSMGAYKKLLLRLKLPPVLLAYSVNNSDGDFGQDYTFGDAGEMKLMVYFQTNMTYDYESFNIDVDADHWIFVDERYYDFTLVMGVIDSGYVTDINYGRVAFELPTYNGTIDAWFIYSYQNWTVEITPEFADKNSWPVRTEAGTWYPSPDLFELTINWRVWITINARDVYEYGLNCSFLVSPVDTNSTSYGAVVRNVTWVYSHGGFSQNFASSGSAGKIAGGEALEMYANNNSWTYNEMIFHNLQHVKMLPTISGKVGLQAYGIYYTLDYWLNGQGWTNAIQLYIEPEVIAYQNILGGGEVWISYHTAWSSNGTLIKVDDAVYMFHHGDSANVGDSFYHQAWFDFWFSTLNASTTVGGRFNAYEYAMSNNAPWYLRWLTSSFNPKTNVTKESMSFAPLRDSNGEIMGCSQVQLMRIGCRLEVVASTTNQSIIITRYQVLDETFGNTPLQGIQTPAFDPTVTPTVSGGGLFGFLGSAFASIGKWLSDNIIFGGLALWPMFVGFLDTIAGWLGFPRGFTNFLAWLGSGWSWMVSSFTWIIGIFVPIFTLLGAVLSKLITLLADIATYWYLMIVYTSNFFNGTYTAGVNFWVDFNMPQWIILFIIVYPIYLIFLWDEEGLDAVISQLTFIFGILSMLVTFFLDVIRTVIGVISTIVESIPVVE